jgi:hypothetical protein
VQDLHADPATGFMHRVRDEAMTGHFARTGQLAGKRFRPACAVRRDPAADQQTRATAGARREIRREFGEIGGAILQPGVHRTHDDAIRELHEPEIEWCEEPRIHR